VRRSDAMYPSTVLRSKDADSPPPPPPKKNQEPTSRHVDRHSQPLPTKGSRSAHVLSDRYRRGRGLGAPRVSSELPPRTACGCCVTCIADISPQGSPRRVHALPKGTLNARESLAGSSRLLGAPHTACGCSSPKHLQTPAVSLRTPVARARSKAPNTPLLTSIHAQTARRWTRRKP